MNYIKLINNAWILREQGLLTGHEQDLYMYLLNKCNMLYWKTPFCQPTVVLCSILGMNRNALTTRRRKLKQLGLIKYKEGKTKSKPAEYITLDTDIQYINHKTNENETICLQQQKQTDNKNFLPPDLSEVEKYCKERNNRVNPHRFIDFYTAKGWMVGKNKMKDWKAAVRTWEQRDKKDIHPAASKPTSKINDDRF